LLGLLIVITDSLFSQTQTCPINIDYGMKNLTHWAAYTGCFQSQNSRTPVVTTVYDSLITSTPNTVNVVTIPEYLQALPGIQVLSTAAADPFGGFMSIPNINGYQYKSSIKLGSTDIVTSKGGLIRGLSYLITVPPGLPTQAYTVTYAYALVLENGSHPNNQQPLLQANLTTLSGNMSCASYSYYLPTTNNGNTLDVAAATQQGFSLSATPSPNNAAPGSLYRVWTKGWTEVTFDLAPYRGQTVSLTFEADNCVHGAHFAYAYIALRDICSGLSISGNSSPCVNSIVNYSVPALANASYNWTVPAGWVIQPPSGTTNILSVKVGNAAGNVAVNEVNSCANLNASFPVTPLPLANAGVVAGASPLCIGSTTTYSSNGDVGGVWSSSNPSVATVDPTTGIVTAVAAGTSTITYTVNAGCSSPVTSTKIITISPNANAGVVAGASPLCIGSTTTYSSNGDVGGVWSSSNPSVATVNASTGLVTAISAGTSIITYTVTGCGLNLTSTKTITVNPNANAGVVAGASPLCIGSTTTYSSSGDVGGVWSSSNPSVATVDPTTGIVTAVAAGTSTITYTVIGCGTNMLASKTIIVTAKAVINFKASITNTCSPMNVVFDNNSSTDSSIVYRLKFGNGVDTVIKAIAHFNYAYYTVVDMTFNAVITASNVCGTDSIVIPLTYKSNPLVVSINAKDSAICNNSNRITFYNTTIGAKNFVWDFGDGSQVTSNQSPDSITHVFKPGNYTVSVLIQTNCGDTTVYRKVFVYQQPKVSFSTASTDLCIGDSVRFLNTTAPVINVAWNFGDGNSSVDQSPYHQYQNAGLYKVWLKGMLQYSNAICYDSSSAVISIVSNKKGYMQVSDTIGKCTPFKVTFNNRGLVSSKTVWDFGDGTSAVGDTVTHIYTKNGKYKATMSSLTIQGCTFNDTVYVTVSAASAQLQSNNAASCVFNQVNFKAITTNTDSIQWSFGDGTSAVTASNNISHVYNKGGVYIATIIAKNNAGCSIAAIAGDTVKVEELKAGFNIAAVYDCGKTTFAFKDSSTSLFGIQSWTWITNNTDSSHQQNTNKIFLTAGKNTTSLIIRNGIGCSDTVKVDYDVLIYQNPKAKIDAIGEACKQVLINFNSNITSKDSVVSHYWDFGNGLVSKDSTVKIMYYSDGSYAIKLIVSTINNCYDSAYKAITIHPTPAIVITGANTVCRGDSIAINASGALSYMWKDQNNNIICNGCASTIVKPISNASYQVIGYNQYGCSDIKSTNIKVIQPFTMNTVASDSICIGTEKVMFANGADNYTWYPPDFLNSTTTAVTTAKPLNDITYHVIGRDNYNCFADTAEIKIAVGKPSPINIGLDTVLQAGDKYQFNPHFSGAPIKNWNWIGNDLSCNNCATPMMQIKKDICVVCNTTNVFNCVSTDTTCIKVFCPTSEIFVPNAFSPDGDGINDVLLIQGKGIANIKSFRIFSRWGELVFERKNFLPGDPSCGWDGKVRGKAAPADVFVYVCEVICDAGYPAIFKGNTAILK
jgi:gliding motility-associated-like protein